MAILQIMSDLHLEAPLAYDVFEISTQCPNLALLGDIGNVKDPGFFQFLEAQLNKFAIVFLLLGNHEPYGSDWQAAKSKINEFSSRVNRQTEKGATPVTGEFVLLDRRRYDITPSVTILGCTLHSKISESQEERVSFGLNDFFQIENWSTEEHCATHVAELAWLNEQVAAISAEEPDRRVVIFTHHSPTFDPRSVNPAHADSPISSGFSTDLSAEECWTNTQVHVWAFGHTHFNCDYIDEKTGKRVIANQRGYYFAQAAGFDPGLVISV